MSLGKRIGLLKTAVLICALLCGAQAWASPCNIALKAISLLSFQSHRQFYRIEIERAKKKYMAQKRKLLNQLTVKLNNPYFSFKIPSSLVDDNASISNPQVKHLVAETIRRQHSAEEFLSWLSRFTDKLLARNNYWLKSNNWGVVTPYSDKERLEAVIYSVAEELHSKGIPTTTLSFFAEGGALFFNIVKNHGLPNDESLGLSKGELHGALAHWFQWIYVTENMSAEESSTLFKYLFQNVRFGQNNTHGRIWYKAFDSNDLSSETGFGEMNDRCLTNPDCLSARLNTFLTQDLELTIEQTSRKIVKRLTSKIVCRQWHPAAPHRVATLWQLWTYCVVYLH